MPTGQGILEGQGETRKGSKVSYKGNQKVKKYLWERITEN